MRGWLLATSNDDEISRRTRLSFDVIRAFRHLFFDVTVFRDHIDLIEWVRETGEAPDAAPGSTQYVRWAVMYGVEAVAYLSGLPVAIDPGVVQTQAMVDGHFKALMGREAGLDSGVAREALKHQQMAVAQAAALAKKAPMTESVALKIKHREMTSSMLDLECHALGHRRFLGESRGLRDRHLLVLEGLAGHAAVQPRLASHQGLEMPVDHGLRLDDPRVDCDRQARQVRDRFDAVHDRPTNVLRRSRGCIGGLASLAHPFDEVDMVPEHRDVEEQVSEGPDDVER